MLDFERRCDMEKLVTYLLDGKEYTFKNERTLGLLTVTPKGLILDEAMSGKHQRLTVVLKSDGSVALKDRSKGYVGKKCKGYTDYDSKDSAIGFRIAALGNRRFRITLQATKYKKVLTANNNGELRIRRFDPNDKGAVWIIS